jgi:hypothetical protein
VDQHRLYACSISHCLPGVRLDDAAALPPLQKPSVCPDGRAEALELLAVAKLLKSVFPAEELVLVILGKQAIDDDCNQTGQMLTTLTG